MIDKKKIELTTNPNGKVVSILVTEGGITMSVPLNKENRHFQELMKLAKKEPNLINFDFTEYDKS
ncbi:MAG: hypothetical protein MOGMAGMI_01843 [Candidatus Omnitrophica bacterium]|nr:hypothetical protein [Candidatus Omnitrophota bacterium]